MNDGLMKLTALGQQNTEVETDIDMGSVESGGSLQFFSSLFQAALFSIHTTKLVMLVEGMGSSEGMKRDDFTTYCVF